MSQYGVIYIDPPWDYRMRNGRSAAAQHYPTLTTPELCALDLPRLYAKDCAVFMWATWPNLQDAFTVASAWGLRYATCAFLWAKTTREVGQGWMFDRLDSDRNWFMGMGYDTRSNTEPCLLFKHGKPRRLPSRGAVRQLIVEPRREHSRKPDRVYSDIEKLYPGPYLEIFSRNPGVTNWDALGNAVDGQDIRDVLRRADRESL